ncbi:MAG: hypothetical protein DME52_11475, partial [Verrucomicrobia bacterium]
KIIKRRLRYSRNDERPNRCLTFSRVSGSGDADKEKRSDDGHEREECRTYFHETSSCASGPNRSRFPGGKRLRKLGLELPNGLGA